jgi:hypothetical protein
LEAQNAQNARVKEKTVSTSVYGARRFVLDDGPSVNWVDETTFRTLTGKTLWRV